MSASRKPFVTGRYDRGARGGGMPRAINDDQEADFRGLVESHREATYDELTALWAKRKKNDFRSSVIRAVQRLGVSLKEKLIQASQKLSPDNKQRRKKFVRALRRIPAEKLIFLDEADFAASLRRDQARSLIGTPA